MRWSVAFVCVTILLLSAGSAGYAADIVVTKASGPTLRLSGPLTRGDAEAMKRILSALPASSSKSSPRATIELSSRGGDLYEGLKLGYLFRDHNVATVVRRGDICISACALAFLGGTSSHEGSERSVDHRLEAGTRGLAKPGRERQRSFATPPISASTQSSSLP